MSETQPIWYPAQRIVRTIVQALVVLIPVMNSVAAAVIAYLNEQTSIVVHPTVFLWLNGIIAVTAVAMGLVARVMAVPGVNDALVKFGLGSVPKPALQSDTKTPA